MEQRKKTRWFRLWAIGLGFLTFAPIEFGLYLADKGEPARHEDPFIGFSSVHPLFTLDEHGRNYEIPESRQRYFAKASFPVEKKENTFRVFCLGGSTVQGRPYSAPTAFPKWLELCLKAASPDVEWEIINCGGISYASYRLIPILLECLNYHPDLIILCTGHNEFLEDRSYSNLKSLPTFIGMPLEVLSRTRTFNQLRSLALRFTGMNLTDRHGRTLLRDETDTMLDYRRGLEIYHRNDEWSLGVTRHFRYNLEQMIERCRSKAVPLVLVKPPCNLSDSPPFKSENNRELTPSEQEEWNEVLVEYKESTSRSLPESLNLLKNLHSRDPRHAWILYELGKLHQQLNQSAEAREYFEMARDEDICPLRMTGMLERELDEVALQHGIPLLDAHRLLDELHPEKIIGNEILVDHIHPGFEGHQKIAEALFGILVESEWIHPQDKWQETKKRLYSNQMNSLNEKYFAKGKLALRDLIIWSQGRADGPSIDERFQHLLRNIENPTSEPADQISND